jgi:hypothetical protein
LRCGVKKPENQFIRKIPDPFHSRLSRRRLLVTSPRIEIFDLP